ncbi:winged helix-turn-helix domain-containing protein [Haloarcula sp. S1CR25-12]|uniref:Winged helix-turn-helix domain-containing protein n=1 Tax=Haloarcula saliterrae TaxID=2950534 RepID=A0ABU2FI00_9EURY|nr:winged helix-turn-helix domain-containing protein [Haloarcula sp. S1CR25-12]MDS0261883.1 winged helix-turn-helix domain-containing protein [Haloarcula sp. S1CR25-12]
MSNGLKKQPDAHNESTDRREQLNLITQETRFVLIQNILSHPEQLPTLKELDYVNPGKSQSTIREHLERLIEADIVEEVTLPEDKRQRDLPWQFYGLTAAGRQLLEDADLLGAEPTLQDMYSMLETTPQIEKYASAPRPDREASGSTSGIDPLREYIENTGNSETVTDQIAILTTLTEAGIGPDHEGVTRQEITERIGFDHSPGTVIQHLVDSNLLEAIEPPGPSTYAISERRQEIINGEVEETVEEELENLIDDMVTYLDEPIVSVDEFQSGDRVIMSDGSGETIRSILSDEFDIPRSDVETYLRDGDRLSKLNRAVDAIEDSQGVDPDGDYGRIVFRAPAQRYRLTETAVELAR